MSSLLDKVSTLISANLHSLLDQALEANSPAVLDQYIRQVEDNLADLTDAAATVGGEVKSIERRLAEQRVKLQQYDQAVDEFLRQGKEAASIAAQTQYNSTARIVETYEAQHTQQQGEFQKLLDAKVKLEARLAVIKQEREELNALLELAKSKETTLKAIKSLDDLAGVGDADIARIGAGIRERLDKATVASEMHASSLNEQMDNVLERTAIDNQLAERKRKLGLSNQS